MEKGKEKICVRGKWRGEMRLGCLGFFREL